MRPHASGMPRAPYEAERCAQTAIGVAGTRSIATMARPTAMMMARMARMRSVLLSLGARDAGWVLGHSRIRGHRPGDRTA
jgi:hypothetical protein